jgi:hypothetical protein
MPAGLVDALFEGERDDLFKFLSELGKSGPFDVTKSKAARLWQIAVVNAAEAERARRGDPQLAGWTPLTTTLAGALVKGEVRATLPKDLADKQVYAVTRFEATKAGPATLTLSEAPSTVWLDGQEVKGQKELKLDLGRGSHTLAIRLDPAAVPDQLILQSPDVVFRPD